MKDCPPEELLHDYLDDEGTQEVEEHISQCLECQERVRSFQDLGASLRSFEFGASTSFVDKIMEEVEPPEGLAAILEYLFGPAWIAQGVALGSALLLFVYSYPSIEYFEDNFAPMELEVFSFLPEEEL